MEISKETKTEYKFKISLADGSVYNFSIFAKTEEEAKEKIRANLLEAANQIV